jgi:hypothetical protein
MPRRRTCSGVRAKSADKFLPLGPWVETDLDPSNTWVRTYVNDELRQEGHTSAMIFSVAEILAYISSFMTLEPLDVVLTGTPSGVGALNPATALRWPWRASVPCTPASGQGGEAVVKVLDLRFQGVERVIASFLLESKEGPILIETGPESTYARWWRLWRRRAMPPRRCATSFVTHIHLDHAGAAWRLAEGGATVYVHPQGGAPPGGPLPAPGVGQAHLRGDA